MLHASEHVTLSPVPDQRQHSLKAWRKVVSEWVCEWVCLCQCINLLVLHYFCQIPQARRNCSLTVLHASEHVILNPVPDQRQPLLRGMGVWRKVVSEWVCEWVCQCQCINLLVLSCIILSNPSGSQELQSLPRGGVSTTRQRACCTQPNTRSKTASAKRNGSMEESGE